MSKRDDPTARFQGTGVSFRGKLYGTAAVKEARGDSMCQQALQLLKNAVKNTGDHKPKVILRITMSGVTILDSVTAAKLYEHPVHRISFIAKDSSDSRSLGYVAAGADGKHVFYGFKTEKAAETVCLTLKDLFQAIFELTRKEPQKKSSNVTVTTNKDKAEIQNSSSAIPPACSSPLTSAEKENEEVSPDAASTNLLSLLNDLRLPAPVEPVAADGLLALSDVPPSSRETKIAPDSSWPDFGSQSVQSDPFSTLESSTTTSTHEKQENVTTVFNIDSIMDQHAPAATLWPTSPNAFTLSTAAEDPFLTFSTSSGKTENHHATQASVHTRSTHAWSNQAVPTAHPNQHSITPTQTTSISDLSFSDFMSRSLDENKPSASTQPPSTTVFVDTGKSQDNVWHSSPYPPFKETPVGQPSSPFNSDPFFTTPNLQNVIKSPPSQNSFSEQTVFDTGDDFSSIREQAGDDTAHKPSDVFLDLDPLQSKHKPKEKFFEELKHPVNPTLNDIVHKEQTLHSSQNIIDVIKESQDTTDPWAEPVEDFSFDPPSIPPPSLPASECFSDDDSFMLDPPSMPPPSLPSNVVVDLCVPKPPPRPAQRQAIGISPPPPSLKSQTSVDGVAGAAPTPRPRNMFNVNTGAADRK